jgi:hypothetical protein
VDTLIPDLNFSAGYITKKDSGVCIIFYALFFWKF